MNSNTRQGTDLSTSNLNYTEKKEKKITLEKNFSENSTPPIRDTTSEQWLILYAVDVITNCLEFHGN